METLGGLIALVSILLFFVAIIGLIYPKITKQENRKSVLKKFLLPSFLLFILAGIVIPSPNDKNKIDQTNNTTTQDSQTKTDTATEDDKQNSSSDKKAIEEQENKDKVEAKQKVKEEQEAKDKAEAEQKAKEEQEAKDKAETEQKAKEEQEAKDKAEAEQEAKDKAEAEQKAKEEQEVKEKEEAQKQKGLDVTYDALISRIKNNELTNTTGIKPKVSTENTRPDGMTIKNVMLKKETMAMITEEKENGELVSINFMASGDGTISSGSDILLGLAMLIQATDGKMTSKQAGSLMMEDLKLTKIEKDGDSHEATKNGRKYSLSISSMLGTMLTISPQ